jgi:hypothetical protein
MGTMYVYSTEDGQMLRQYDTNHTSRPSTAWKGKGGGFGGAAGPVVANEMLCVSSGHADLFGPTARKWTLGVRSEITE